MNELRGDEMRGFWRTLITVPNVMMLLGGLVLVAGWKQNQDTFREQTEQRIVRLETQLSQTVTQSIAESTENKVSRALLSAQLAQIQLDLASLRVEVKDVRSEVRKIR